VKVRPNGPREVYLQVGCLGRTFVSAISAESLVTTAGFLLFLSRFRKRQRVFGYIYYFLREAVFSLFLFNFSISYVPFFYIYFPFANYHLKMCIFLYVLQQKICVIQKKAVLLQSKCVYNTHPDFFTTFFF
jgi:hypothetical protein